MSAPNPPPPRMLGDLPLIPASRFDAVSDNYWSERGMDGLHWFNAGREMEFLQRLLYADQKEVCDVDLDTRHRLAKWLWRYCKTIGYSFSWPSGLPPLRDQVLLFRRYYPFSGRTLICPS